MRFIKKLRERFANWLLNDIHIRKPLHFGKNSISISPLDTGFSILDVVRWSASADPEDPGDMGMDLASGRPVVRSATSGSTVQLGVLRQIYMETLASDVNRGPGLGFANFLTKAITVANNCTLVLRMSASGSVTAPGTDQDPAFRFTIDGTPVGTGTSINMTAEANQASDSGALTVVVTGVAAGAHTVALQWATNTKTGSLGTANIDPLTRADTDHCVITIEEYTSPTDY